MNVILRILQYTTNWILVEAFRTAIPYGLLAPTFYYERKHSRLKPYTKLYCKPQ